MARLDQRHARNAAGEWFVDERCIDCDTCRELAPEVFVDIGTQSVVGHQPGPDQERRAWFAAVACPTQSIGTIPRRRRPDGLFPHRVDDGVSLLGWNAEESFGADSYLVTRPEGNLLVDSPRFTKFLTEPIDALGGIAHVLLTHRDDVADAARWAERYGSRVWIHPDDADAAPFATDLLDCERPTTIAPGVRAIPVPGHTRGSAVFLVDDRSLFSGDSLSWNRTTGDLHAFRSACWYSWSEQTRSLARLADEARFEWVLPGHGGRVNAPADELHERLRALVQRMKAAA